MGVPSTAPARGRQPLAPREQRCQLPSHRRIAAAATQAQWQRAWSMGEQARALRGLWWCPRALVRHHRVAALVLSPCKENTMTPSETEIHRIVLRLLREGYSALTSAQRKVVDSLMAVC